jgi:hypothetical protein
MAEGADASFAGPPRSLSFRRLSSFVSGRRAGSTRNAGAGDADARSLLALLPGDSPELPIAPLSPAHRALRGSLDGADGAGGGAGGGAGEEGGGEGEGEGGLSGFPLHVMSDDDELDEDEAFAPAFIDALLIPGGSLTGALDPFLHGAPEGGPVAPN